jgi:cellulose synthase/poly-beta-1,6-N-acetylglucosamine synthase-like glycosyltransferase
MDTLIHNFFIITFFVFLGYYLLLAVYSFILGFVGISVDHNRGKQDAEEDYVSMAASSFALPVSIILPAHNEEQWIADSVQCLLNLDYPEYEILIVDDGSTDQTLEILTTMLDLESMDNPYTDRFNSGKINGLFKSRRHPRVTVLSEEGGKKKAGAVNSGLNLVRYKYVCVVDVDTIIEPDALLKVMAQIQKDPERIIGVGSYFGLINGFEVEKGRVVEKNFVRSPLIAYQDLEYLRSFIGNRISWSLWNAIPVIAGGFGVWRRDVLVEMGGYDPNLSCEDIEVTFRAQEFMAGHKALGYKLMMLPYVMGWTEGPATVMTLIRQRNRWHRATIETIWKFRHMLFNPRYGAFGFVTMPYFFLYEVMGVFFEVGSIAITLAGFLLGVFSLKLLIGFLLFMTLFQAFTSMMPLIAFHHEQKIFRPREFLYLTFLSLVEFLVYRWVIVIARTSGTIDYFRGSRVFDTVPRFRNKGK